MAQDPEMNSPSPPGEEVLSFLRERHSETLELVLWVRHRVLSAEPDLEERVYRGWNGIGYRYPVFGLVCAIYPQRDGTVRLLFERGRELNDPDGTLEGDGSQTRYVTFSEPDTDEAGLILRFVPEAVAQRIFRR